MRFPLAQSLACCAALFAAALSLAPAGLDAQAAGSRNRAIVQNELSGAQREQLRSLTATSREALRLLEEQVDADSIKAKTREILAQGSLNIAAREVDAEGRAAIHRYLSEEIEALAGEGLEYVGSMKSLAVVPRALEKVKEGPRAGERTQLTVGGKTFRVDYLWPNGAMPSLTPAAGIDGPLVYAGKATWEEVNGLELDGAIAVMDFGGGRNFERLFSLGAAAVIVVEDDFVTEEKARGLFMSTPLPFPRFYADKETGEALRARLGETARLTGGSLYEERPIESLFAYLPPSAPRSITLAPNRLAELIASDFGLSAGELLKANKLDSPVLEAGQELFIPGRTEGYTVREDDLLQRLGVLYAVSPEELLEASGLTRAEFVPGATITIPNAAGTVVLYTPIDAMSVVPERPHGAKVASNLAVALLGMEYLARAEELDRRRGVLFVFGDGDTVGGLHSRRLAEYALLQRGLLAEGTGGQDVQVDAETYTEGRPFFRGEIGDIDEAAAGWLAEGWLFDRLEKARIAVAEQRIPYILALGDANQRPEDFNEAVFRERLAALDAELDQLVEVRRGSLDRFREPAEVRLRALYESLQDPQYAEVLRKHELTLGELEKRYARELREEARIARNHENNKELAARVLALLNEGSAQQRYRLGIQLDLSGDTPNLGYREGSGGQNFYSTLRNPFYGRGLLPEFETRLRAVAAYVHDFAGWELEYPFVTDDDRATFDGGLLTFATPVYEEFWSAAQIFMLPLGTLNAPMARLDTPHDVPERVHFGNIAAQARTLLSIFSVGVENPSDSNVRQSVSRLEYGRLQGRVVEFNIRSGIDANEPVPSTTLYAPFRVNRSKAPNTGTYHAHRTGVMQLSRLNGSFQFPVEVTLLNPAPQVFAYHLDPETALFDRVANEGQVGTQDQLASFSWVQGASREKKIVLAELTPLVFYPGTDPFEYISMGGNTGGFTLTPFKFEVEDAVRNGTPSDFAVDNPVADYGEYDVDSVAFYMTPGRSGRIYMQQGLRYRMMLVGEVEEETGTGILFGAPGTHGQPRWSLPLTSLRIARQMLDMASYRQGLYGKYGITSQALNAAVQRAEAKYEEATAAAQRKDWQESTGLAREAWGILVKNYPRLLNLGRQAVFSVIVLMAFLVAASFFLEKLLFGFKRIVWQLTGTAGLFIAGTLFLNFFHPAFRIALSPFIVVIAFTMILMSIIVLALSYQRFEVLLRRARHAGGEVEGEEISLMSSLSTALSLGVSNLKKHRTRTVLTVLTVTVLTFSIVAFVSVSGGDVATRTPIGLDKTLDGQPVEAEMPAYEGFLLREFGWRTMPGNIAEAVRTEFGAHYPVTTRAFYLEVEGGNAADREGVNQIRLRHDGAEAIIAGVMAFEPQERLFSGLHRAVSGEQWFRGGEEPDRDTIILPQGTAALLGITAEMIVDSNGERRPERKLPRVTFFNREWTVIGILDTAEANTYRDVNGKSLAMVDFQRSGITPQSSGNVESEGPTYHASWEHFALVPMAAAEDIGAELRSVAVKFPEGTDTARFFQDIALRFNRSMFVHENGELSLLTTRAQINLAGLFKVVLPVILCILIVMNTMLGAVDERKGEVNMLGAIGLSPRQISFLILSESTVYSILGILFGTFMGLLFANVVQMLNAGTVPFLDPIDFLSGVSFNFTSLLSILLATLTGVVVLLATLIPASKAASLAAPSGMLQWKLPEPDTDGRIRFPLPFSLTQGNAIGMAAFFEQFLRNHTEITSPDFNCRAIEHGVRELDDGNEAVRLSCDMWLAPYDLDVAQHFAFEVRESESAGVFYVHLDLARFSGSEDNWLRVNYSFLNLVRHQFLLWRNLRQEERERFVKKGAAALRAPSAPASASASA